jgi:hypothetical protein
MLPLAAALPRGWIADALAAPPDHAYRFFDAHQADVVREATARLIPGPDDDPLEAGHAGAREANVVRYIDLLLGAFTVDPPRIHAGGPWSDRAGGEANHMRTFVALSPVQEALWRKRIADLQETYRLGIKSLDAEAVRGDFANASPNEQDQILTAAADFRDVLFVHAIEGFLSVPEYGGNADLVGWKEIRWPGDSQPRGYTQEEVSSSDGLDPVVNDVIVSAALASFGEAVAVMLRRRSYGR